MPLRAVSRHVIRRRASRKFAPERYWETRHQTHKKSLKAVGHVKLTEQQSAEQYAIKRSRLVEMIRRYCPETAGRSLLDAGCGIGLLTGALVEQGFEVVGVDFSETAIERAKAGGIRAQFLVSPLAALNLDQQFDVITAVDVLLHIVVRREWHATLKAFRRHLKQEGVLIILDWLDARVRRMHPHLRVRSERRYARALARAGLRIVEHERFKLEYEGSTKDLLAIKHVEAT